MGRSTYPENNITFGRAGKFTVLRTATQPNSSASFCYSATIKNEKMLIINALILEPVNGSNDYLYNQVCRLLLIHEKLRNVETKLENKVGVTFKSR